MDSHGPVVQPAPDADPGVRATGVTAVVPLRDGVSGKSRLASVLDDDARRALITVLAQHVVGTLLATPQVDGVVVVTADAPFARSALGELSDVGHLAFLAQPTDRPGLNAALDAAREAIGSRLPETAPGGIDVAPGGAPTPHALLVAHADLPALTPGDITDLVMPAAGHASRRRPERPATRHPAGRASSDPADRPAPASGGDAPSGRPHAADVVIATDRMGQGTNLLLLRPGAEHEFRFRFGPASRAAHEAEAARLGLRAVTISSPGTAVDLDTVDDWNELPAAVRSAVGRYARFPSP
ncbi:2-phospho-L-lactate guanylyltransferase [Myceligenerans sp. TRM 65318]|uniref:Phosphoenolpyruvate guanylyltransferase n=2 Tax=Myceligenerans pegani TaxID=2776917 RepID=A0ABR9MUT2_9MICO|nr:2-phospho-L-lactate guanylyltransferase [Myceligenerans sp. TRM 65318]MBE3017414.1 2-phospho-L-lactate guanylyltransferase [Myceligenerans sp. TRM 65318]